MSFIFVPLTSKIFFSKCVALIDIVFYWTREPTELGALPSRGLLLAKTQLFMAPTRKQASSLTLVVAIAPPTATVKLSTCRSKLLMHATDTVTQTKTDWDNHCYPATFTMSNGKATSLRLDYGLLASPEFQSRHRRA